MRKQLALALCLLIVTSCVVNTEENNTMERITFQTEDGVTIVGNYWHGSSTGVLLLHMMPATKESWDDFASALHHSGMSVLAIDLRGHGESTKHDGRTLDSETFTDQQHQASIYDVESAAAYLKERGITTLFLAGASIGANLALQYQSEHPEIKKVILFSPGVNYRGILTEPLAERLQESQEVLLVAGALDGRAAGRADLMAQQIASHVQGRHELKIYQSASHGTDLFRDDPQLITLLARWLQA